ncbi:MAG: aldo/keto reductase, partial [Betaproteobacteria bacterium AqS2]|nr:aldo/keto reductase [Betaproteobacteria bacterium AqS2]
KNYSRVYGTFGLNGDAALKAFACALETGYRSFDTAQMYGNEAELGEAIETSGVPRAELCITTKVEPGNMHEASFMPSVEESLRKLRVDQVDLLLLHWPPPGGDVGPSLALLADARKRGLAAHVGVSNYNVSMLQTAAVSAAAPIDVNQVEFHPLLDQSKLLAGSRALGIPLAAYCSVARGEIFKHAVLAEIGERHGKSAAQVALRWILQQGVIVITKAASPANIKANYAIDDFELTAEEMEAVTALTATGYRIVNSDVVSWAPEFD